MERIIKPEPVKFRALSPEEEVRLAEDQKFLEEELHRIEAELEIMTMCNIRMDGDFDLPIRPRIKHKVKNFESNPL